MKKLAIIAIILNISSQAFAFDTIPAVCYKKAAIVASKFAGSGYDKNGFEAFECDIAPNEAVILCNVSASKGDGAANDTYLVVLNRSCTRALRVDLTGEE